MRDFLRALRFWVPLVVLSGLGGWGLAWSEEHFGLPKGSLGQALMVVMVIAAVVGFVAFMLMVKAEVDEDDWD